MMMGGKVGELVISSIQSKPNKAALVAYFALFQPPFILSNCFGNPQPSTTMSSSSQIRWQQTGGSASDDDHGSSFDDNLSDCDSVYSSTSSNNRGAVVNPDDPNGAWRTLRQEQVFFDPLEKSANAAEEEHVDGNDYTRFVLMSDTHGKHRHIRPPPGDVLIHAGGKM